MESVLELIKNARKIIFFTGAGVSTNCGLPDFRGENGLYSYVEKKYGLPYPEAIFDINYFHNDPKPFFLLTSELLNNQVSPSITHNFITWLEKEGKVSVIATQNIDMLHEKSGSESVLACHGTYSDAKCLNCGKEYKLNDIEGTLLKGDIPSCFCGGIVKPNITFFGESLPSEFYNTIENPPEADLVVVMGTSLAVQPAASLPLMYRGKCPLVLVNRDKTDYDSYFDYIIYSDCDKFSKSMWDSLRGK